MITNSNSDKKLLNKYIQTYKICNTLLEVVHENAFNFITFFRGEKSLHRSILTTIISEGSNTMHSQPRLKLPADRLPKLEKKKKIQGT